MDTLNWIFYICFVTFSCYVVQDGLFLSSCFIFPSIRIMGISYHRWLGNSQNLRNISISAAWNMGEEPQPVLL